MYHYPSVGSAPEELKQSRTPPVVAMAAAVARALAAVTATRTEELGRAPVGLTAMAHRTVASAMFSAAPAVREAQTRTAPRGTTHMDPAVLLDVAALAATTATGALDCPVVSAETARTAEKATAARAAPRILMDHRVMTSTVARAAKVAPRIPMDHRVMTATAPARRDVVELATMTTAVATITTLDLVEVRTFSESSYPSTHLQCRTSHPLSHTYDPSLSFDD